MSFVDYLFYGACGALATAFIVLAVCRILGIPLRFTSRK